MNNYLTALKKVYSNWVSAIFVTVFTVARLFYGWAFFHAGFEKATSEHWLSDGKPDAKGLIAGMINNIDLKAHRFDPLHLNVIWGWVANNIFQNMPYVTDFLVIVFEMAIGLFIIFGFKAFWAALAATFLNLQFFAAGSTNNFGYIWTNLVIMKWSRYFEAIGVDGFLRGRKGKDLLTNKPLEDSGSSTNNQVA